MDNNNQATVTPSVPPKNEIRAWMALTNRTQATLAEELGMSPNHLSQILNGHKGISLRRALRASELSGLPVTTWAALSRRSDDAAA